MQFKFARQIFSQLGGGCVSGWIVWVSFLCPVAEAADPLQQLRSFSSFSSVEIKRLEAGEILGEPGSQMEFANGISAETCFVVPIAPEDAAKRLQIWDPSLRGTLKTLEFHPVDNPCTAADFQNLKLKPADRPQRWLLDKSRATTSTKADLHLSREECQRLAILAKSKPSGESINAYWSSVLFERAREFQEKGFAGLSSYEVTSPQVSPQAHLRSLVKEREAISSEFAALLRQSGLLGNDGKGTLDPYYYWAMYEANHHATLTLGAVYLRPEGNLFQLLDVQYYVNGTYYTSATLYEVLPFQVRGKPGSLIWRGDFFSAPKIAYTRGVERLAYAAVMLKELKTSIRHFQEEALKPVSEPARKAQP